MIKLARMGGDSRIHIVDNENVRRLPTGFLPNVAKAVRAFAACLDDGSIKARKAFIVTVDEDGFLDLAAFGEHCGSAEGIGLLELAKAKVVAGTWRQL